MLLMIGCTTPDLLMLIRWLWIKDIQFITAYAVCWGISSKPLPFGDCRNLILRFLRIYLPLSVCRYIAFWVLIHILHIHLNPLLFFIFRWKNSGDNLFFFPHFEHILVLIHGGIMSPFLFCSSLFYLTKTFIYYIPYSRVFLCSRARGFRTRTLLSPR